MLLSTKAGVLFAASVDTQNADKRIDHIESLEYSEYINVFRSIFICVAKEIQYQIWNEHAYKVDGGLYGRCKEANRRGNNR